MKKTTLFLAILAALIGAQPAHAAKRYFERAIFPGQAMLERQSFGTPSAAGTTSILNAHAGATGTSAVVVTSFAGQPDIPRNLVITPGGTTADVGACTVTVAGTNILGQSISEDFAFLANASSATTGAKAFKTVTSVTFPANCEDSPFGATWSIGVGEKIGIARCMDYAGDWAWSEVAGAYESTRATVAVNATAVESNTADFNGTMNGSNAFIGHYVQNFRCGE